MPRGAVAVLVLAALLGGCVSGRRGSAQLSALPPPTMTAPPQESRVESRGLESRAPAGSAPDTTGSLGHAALSPKPAGRAEGPLTLTHAVRAALAQNPEILTQQARTREARAGAEMAASALYPTLDARLGAGASGQGRHAGEGWLPRTGATEGTGRIDAGLTLRQTLYDFGAARSDVSRAEALTEAELSRLREKRDEIAARTAQAYLKVLEQRALLGLADEVIAAHRELARFIEANQREGNSTVADVRRIASRLSDIQAIRSDIDLQMRNAEEALQRLARVEPGRLAPAPRLVGFTPPDPARAIAETLKLNPRLQALEATSRSLRSERASQEAAARPRLTFEVENDSKTNTAGNGSRHELDARGMLVLRYRFLDGGLARATREQILAREDANEMRLLNEREQMEADLRQAYRAIASAGAKARLVGQGLASAREVRKLYMEQFKAGKRTTFELLDSQMSFFASARSEIESRFDAERAAVEILRAMGRLSGVLVQDMLPVEPAARTGAVRTAGAR